jgi:FAD/FMN-containing dehydrogenase
VRGGGCNFGVVTEFVYQLHPQRRTVYAGMLVFPAAVLEKFVAIVTEWWANGKGPGEKEAMVQMLTRGPDRAVRLISMLFFESPHLNKKAPLQPCIVAIVFYNGSEVEGRANFKRFFDLGTYRAIGPYNVGTLVDLYCQAPSWIRQRRFRTKS